MKVSFTNGDNNTIVFTFGKNVITMYGLNGGDMEAFILHVNQGEAYTLYQTSAYNGELIVGVDDSMYCSVRSYHQSPSNTNDTARFEIEIPLNDMMFAVENYIISDR